MKEGDRPAFPAHSFYSDGSPQLPDATNSGVTLRDWFATFAPRPQKWQIDLAMQSDRNRNPHNDSHKPPIRSQTEVIAALRYDYADAMIKARSSNRK
jgi:hypothetical protein